MLMRLEELNAYVWRGSNTSSVRPVIPTGFSSLDRQLPGGGWPSRSVTEVFVDQYGIGELTLLMPALTSLTRQDDAAEKKWLVWVAPPFIPYAPALQRHGVKIDRLLFVDPSAERINILWAVEQIVRSGSTAAVLGWVTAASGVVLRRLQLASEQQGCWTILFRPIGALRNRSPAALRLRLSHEGSITRVQILKSRGGRPTVVDLQMDQPDSGELQ